MIEKDNWIVWGMVSLIVLIVGTSAIELGIATMSWRAHLEAERMQFEQLLHSHFGEYSSSQGLYATEGKEQVQSLIEKVDDLQARLEALE